MKQRPSQTLVFFLLFATRSGIGLQEIFFGSDQHWKKTVAIHCNRTVRSTQLNTFPVKCYQYNLEEEPPAFRFKGFWFDCMYIVFSGVLDFSVSWFPVSELRFVKVTFRTISSLVAVSFCSPWPNSSLESTKLRQDLQWWIVSLS